MKFRYDMIEKYHDHIQRILEEDVWDVLIANEYDELLDEYILFCEVNCSG